LTTTLSDSEEVGDIGRSENLVLCFRVLNEEFAEESFGFVQFFVRLKRRDLESGIVDVRETFFDTANPVTSEVAEGRIDPALLVSDVHETDETSIDFGVGHIGEVARSTISLGGELFEKRRKKKSLARRSFENAAEEKNERYYSPKVFGNQHSDDR